MQGACGGAAGNNTATVSRGQNDFYGRADRRKAPCGRRCSARMRLTTYWLCAKCCVTRCYISSWTHLPASCWGVPFIIRGQRCWSELVGRGQSWMELPSCSKHRARVTKGRFTLEHFHRIERPRQSPDLQLLGICSKAWKLLSRFHRSDWPGANLHRKMGNKSLDVQRDVCKNAEQPVSITGNLPQHLGRFKVHEYIYKVNDPPPPRGLDNNL